MFKEIPVSPVSRGAPRKLVFGKGVNDAPYKTSYTGSDGKEYRCPYYTKWRSLLERVYSPKVHAKYPNYAKCTVDPVWHSFMAFRSWMITQDWVGKQLDKDLLIQGNTHYSPSTCLFLSDSVNKLLCLRGNHTGAYPLGVSFTPNNKPRPYVAHCSFYGKSRTLGYFPTVAEAEATYKQAKLAYIKELADQEPNPVVKQALLRLA